MWHILVILNVGQGMSHLKAMTAGNDGEGGTVFGDVHQIGEDFGHDH